jgi:hypothetical protein
MPLRLQAKALHFALHMLSFAIPEEFMWGEVMWLV